jgi:hypothetical protein
VSFVSETVLVGFKAGVALYLESTQLPKLFGISGSHGDFWERMSQFFAHLGEMHGAALQLGLAALALLVLGKFLLPNRPVSLFVVGYWFYGKPGAIIGFASAGWVLYPLHATVYARMGLWHPRIDVPVLMASAEIALRDIVGANFFISGSIVFAAAILVALLATVRSRFAVIWLSVLVVAILAASVMTVSGFQPVARDDEDLSLEGVEDKLRSGIRVADIGCGHGASTILMAQAYPASRFVGYDYHAASIATARKRAAANNVNRDEILLVSRRPGAEFEIANAHSWKATVCPMSSAALTESTTRDRSSALISGAMVPVMDFA